MDEEVAAITNDSPLPAMPATDSPEMKGSSPEEHTGKFRMIKLTMHTLASQMVNR